MTHKFQAGQIAVVKSGRIYRIDRLRTDAHSKLKGEPGYEAVMLRDGKPFGPVRLLRESAFTGKSA